MKSKAELEQHIIASYAEAYNNEGLSALMGRIVALLMLSPEPQSLDDIALKLEMSKGPVSQICRRLKDRNLIEKVWVPGDRKDYYQPAEDVLARRYQNRLEKYERNAKEAEMFKKQAKEMKGEDTEHIQMRMEELQVFYEMLVEHGQNFIEAWNNRLSEMRDI